MIVTTSRQIPYWERRKIGSLSRRVGRRRQLHYVVTRLDRYLIIHVWFVSLLVSEVGQLTHLLVCLFASLGTITNLTKPSFTFCRFYVLLRNFMFLFVYFFSLLWWWNTQYCLFLFVLFVAFFRSMLWDLCARLTSSWRWNQTQHFMNISFLSWATFSLSPHSLACDRWTKLSTKEKKVSLIFASKCKVSLYTEIFFFQENE
jgi:hypothetical protein